MAQTARNRCDGNMGGYHQACVGVPQAVEVHRREIMRPQEVREPCCQSFQIKGCSVPAGKQQVIFTVFPFSTCTVRAHIDPTRSRSAF